MLSYVGSSVHQKWAHNRMSVWLAQLVKLMAAPTHVHSCVQEVRVQFRSRHSRLRFPAPRGRWNEQQPVCTEWPLQKTANVNHAAVKMATCGLCSRRHNVPHMCFFAVSAGDCKVPIVTKAPKKYSGIYIYIMRHERHVSAKSGVH
jgi:hypothetical protein